MNGRILRLFKISLYSVQMRMAPSWFYLLAIITYGRLVFSDASAKHISQGLEFKSLELCGKITGPTDSVICVSEDHSVARIPYPGNFNIVLAYRSS